MQMDCWAVDCCIEALVWALRQLDTQVWEGKLMDLFLSEFDFVMLVYTFFNVKF